MRLVKSNFLMKVSLLEENKEASEDGKKALSIVDSQWIKMSGKDFERSIEDDKANGIEHKIEIVSAAPERFQVNVIYVLRDGKKAWTYVMK